MNIINFRIGVKKIGLSFTCESTRQIWIK